LRTSHLIMMLILLTFVGQAFASVILPCNMSMNAMSVSTSNTGLDDPCHSKSSPHEMTITTDDGDNCCDQVCRCSSGSCLTLGLTMAMPALSADVKLFGSAAMYTLAPSAQYSPSLYRPPIFA
jgi:hypothetical protein